MGTERCHCPKEIEVGGKRLTWQLHIFTFLYLHTHTVKETSVKFMFTAVGIKVANTNKHSVNSSPAHSLHKHIYAFTPTCKTHFGSCLPTPPCTTTHSNAVAVDTTQHGPLSGHAVWMSRGSIERYPSLWKGMEMSMPLS